ncbi:MYB binding protein 1a [Arctopsyche grandis]|uniref:MYB binding protein 1a n=1 Tax=Arctopsyche grandis TaxID=121162 RepID=UPI00406D7768
MTADTMRPDEAETEMEVEMESEEEGAVAGKGVGPRCGSVPLTAFSQLGEAQVSGALALLPLLLDTRTTFESQEFQYSLTRLIRGIASSRQTAREGYFCTLTILLKYRTDFSITVLLEKLNKELKIGSLSKSETGEVCTGHVLVCGSVIRSGRFISCSEEERAEVIKALFNAGSKKAYLSLPAHVFLTDFIRQSTEEDVREKLWSHLKEPLSCPLNEYSLDSLYCLLTLSDCCPSIVKKLCKKKLKISSLFCDDTLPMLSDKLMSAPEFSFINHPVYEAFGRELAKSDYLVKFWSNGIEPKLNVQNENRVLIALTILGVVLKNIGANSKQIPHLLGEHFLPCILEWFKGFQSATQSGKMLKFKGKQKYFVHENKGKQIILKSKEILGLLQEALQQDGVEDETKLEVLKKLLFYPGDIMFCDITNTRLIKILIEDLKVDGVYNFADILKKVIINESKKTQASSERFWTIIEKLRAAEMLTYLINHRTTIDDVQWRIKNMQFFIQIGLFKALKDDDLYISSELAGGIKKCFFRCLTFRSPKLETLLTILSSLVEYIDKGIKSNPELVAKNVKAFSPVVLESWKTMNEFNKKLTSSEKMQNTKASTVFQILSLHSGLFLFSEIMTTDMAKNSLDEVQSCYDHYVKDKKNKKKSKPTYKDGDIVDVEPEWTEVLVDVFLSFLSRDSYLLRTVVQCVFRLLCEYLTPSAIGQILSVLDPDNDTNILSNKGDDSDDENNDEDDDDIDPENESEEDAEKDQTKEIDEDSSEDDDNDDSNEENDDDDNNITVNDQLRMAVQKALGSAAPDTDTESIDADNIDDEEGKRLDSALSSAFRMLRQSKGEMTKKEKKNIRTVMEFRIRVLDLIQIYLEKVPSMDICLGMLSPLFKCLEFSIKDSLQQPLEKKVRKCIKYLYSIKNFSSSDDVTMEVLANYLTAITSRGNRTQFVFQALGDVITKCSTFIVRCSQKLNIPETTSKKKKKTNISPITEIYKESLEAFFTKRDCLLPVIFFHDILNIKWDGNWILLEKIVEKVVDDNVRQFRKNEALEMINIFYTNLKRGPQVNIAESSNKLKELENNFSREIIAYLNKNDGTNVNERFFTILMKVFISIKNFYNCLKQLTDNMDWKNIGEAVQSCRNHIKLRNNQDYFKFCNVFKLEKLKNTTQVITAAKKESIDSGHDSNTDEEVTENGERLQNGVCNGNKTESNPKSEKRNKSKKGKVTKKESKMLRVQASSEGFPDISFTKLLECSNINVDDIGDESASEEEAKPVKKRKAETPALDKPKKSKKSVA